MKIWESEPDTHTRESTRRTLWSREGWVRSDDPATAAPVPVPSRVASGAAVPPYDRPAPQRVDPNAPIHGIIDRREIEIVFQPLFDASRRQVVGFEALSRGPQGPLRTPGLLFAAARAVGRAGELDWICRAAAFRMMIDARLHPSISLVVNVEPDSLITPCPEHLLPVIWEAESRLRVFIDLPGQGLLRHPIAVLESVRRARAAGWGVVLDDLDVSAAAVSLLPILEPDVIRLGQRLIRQGGDRSGAALAAALTEAERLGTAVLIDNIEQPPGALARAVPAGYLQGRHLAAEGALPAELPVPAAPIPLRNAHTTGLTPCEVLADSSGLMASGVTEESLDRLMRQFVTQAARGPELPVVGVVTSVYRQTTPETVAQHRAALENCPASVLVGRGLAMFQDWRTRAVEAPEGHPLWGELCFVALSAVHSSVLVARPTAVRDGVATSWEVGMSHDPSIGRRVMRELLHHTDRLADGIMDPEDAPA
jgi:EAL domain-containing protein (putative c-di-GMP-specific phosphodiesterase class I)